MRKKFWKMRIRSNENNINNAWNHIRELKEEIYRIEKILTKIIERIGIKKEIEILINEMNLEILKMRGK